jgi:hypothetical protein
MGRRRERSWNWRGSLNKKSGASAVRTRDLGTEIPPSFKCQHVFGIARESLLNRDPDPLSKYRVDFRWIKRLPRIFI